MAIINKQVSNRQKTAGPWYLARIKQPAFSLFSAKFFPKPNRLGHVYVYVNSDNNSNKVQVLNGFDEVRLVASQIAESCFEVVRKVDAEEQTMIETNISLLQIRL